jgi:hypothetical protein
MNDEWKAGSRGISTYTQTVTEAERLTDATLQDKVRSMNVKMMKLEYSHLGGEIFVSSSAYFWKILSKIHRLQKMNTDLEVNKIKINL